MRRYLEMSEIFIIFAHEKMNKVSVIIPVYNSRSFISECLDSLVAQSFRDFEVLLVDDHGQDDSIDLARHKAGEFEKLGINVRFLETPTNSGPGAARNIGLDAATGEYVAFIDADDTWTPDFLETLVAKADQNKADVAFCQCSLRRNPIAHDGDFKGFGKLWFLLRFVTFSVCFLYRRGMLENPEPDAAPIRFPQERSCEDTNFLIKSLLYAKRIACVDKEMYWYRPNPTSITQKKDPTRWKSRLRAWDNLIDECRSRGLMRHYGLLLWFLYLKKGWAIAMIDKIKN